MIDSMRRKYRILMEPEIRILAQGNSGLDNISAYSIKIHGSSIQENYTANQRIEEKSG